MIELVKLAVEWLQVDGQFHLGSGCSGTDIWHHCVSAIFHVWKTEFGVDIPLVVARSSPPKRIPTSRTSCAISFQTWQLSLTMSRLSTSRSQGLW